MALTFFQVVYSLETAAAYSVGHRFHGLANNSMTQEQRIMLSPGSMEFHLRVSGSKLQLIGWSLYTLLLWTLKLCMLGLYTRLTYVLQRASIAPIAICQILIRISGQNRSSSYATPDQTRIRPDRGHVCGDHHRNSCGMRRAVPQELANPPGSRQYVTPCLCATLESSLEPDCVKTTASLQSPRWTYTSRWS